MTGVEEAGALVVAAAAVTLMAMYYWVTAGAPAAQKFINDVKQRVDEAFPDTEPSPTEPCPYSQQPEPAPGPEPEPPPEPGPKPVPPVLPPLPIVQGQRYSDQTCSNTELDILHAKKDSICGSIQTVQPPKKPYADPNGADAAKQARLCDNLRQKEQDLKDCIKARQDIQDRCFNSPKNTPDEVARDQAHKDQLAQLNRALAKTQQQIKDFGCP